MKGSTVLLLVAAVAYLALSGCPPRQIATVPPGVDCFSTPSERSGTRMADQPLPAGFFAPDSEPFQGDLCFHGDPQIALDTCVQRLDKLEFDANGQASTRIELTELDLVGCEPILVKIGGRDTYWDVRGTVSKAKPTTGRMRVSRTSERGGEFDAEFDFLVRMTFTPRDPEHKTVVFDAGELGMQPERIATPEPVPWVRSTDLKIQYDERRGFRPDNGFIPGVLVAEEGDRVVEFQHEGLHSAHFSLLLEVRDPTEPRP
jgi:hypothetical protein